MGLSLDEFDGVIDGVVDLNDRARLLLINFDQNGAVASSSITDRRLIEEIQYHVLEPPNFAFFQSGYWTQSEVLGYANRVQRQFLKDTDLILKRGFVTAAADAVRGSLPSDWITTRRAMLTLIPDVLWRMEEATGTRFDSVGANNLVVGNNVVLGVLGKIGNAARFAIPVPDDTTKQQWLTIPTNATLKEADRDLTIAVWVRIDIVPSTTGPGPRPAERAICNCGDDYALEYVSTNGGPDGKFLWFYRIDNAVPFPATNNIYYAFPVTSGSYHLIVADYNTITKKSSLQVDNGTIIFSSAAAPAIEGVPPATEFHVGNRGGINGILHDGSVDALHLWHRILGTTERSLLWNGGSGREVYSVNPFPYRELPKSSGWAADHGLSTWPLTRGLPQAYMDAETPHLTTGIQEFQIAPASSGAVTLEILYTYLSALLTGEQIVLAVPDEFVPAIKYGIMELMLSKLGRAHDPARAAYCGLRYQEGVEAARLMWP